MGRHPLGGASSVTPSMSCAVGSFDGSPLRNRSTKTWYQIGVGGPGGHAELHRRRRVRRSGRAGGGQGEREQPGATTRAHRGSRREQEGQRVGETGAPRGLVVGGAVVPPDHEVAALHQPLAEEPGAHRGVGGRVGGVESERAVVEPVPRAGGRAQPGGDVAHHVRRRVGNAGRPHGVQDLGDHGLREREVGRHAAARAEHVGMMGHQVEREQPAHGRAHGGGVRRTGQGAELPVDPGHELLDQEPGIVGGVIPGRVFRAARVGAPDADHDDRRNDALLRPAARPPRPRPNRRRCWRCADRTGSGRRACRARGSAWSRRCRIPAGARPRRGGSDRGTPSARRSSTPAGPGRRIRASPRCRCADRA